MRKSLVSLAFLSLLLSASSVLAADAATDEASANAPVAVQHSRAALTSLRDQAAMVLVGTALIGLASAVRRTA
jgi:hypothetical protein